jgi:hypothetical protein
VFSLVIKTAFFRKIIYIWKIFSIIFEQSLEIRIHFSDKTANYANSLIPDVGWKNSIHEEIKEQVEVRERLLSFGAESFVCQFAIRNCKD